MDKRFDRVVLLVDMDSFYCQVEEQLNPELKGRPSAVVQYNAWQGGGIIAVNYMARAKGVTRHMRGDEAKKMCPDIELVRVNSVHGKADLSKYRDAGQQVAEVMARFQGVLERASVDEAYMDISMVVNQRIQAMNSGTYVLPPQQLENTYVPGYDNFGKYASEILNEYVKLDFASGSVTSMDLSNLRLLVGAAFANEIRAAIKQGTGYECSAGIAHNKILAKLACGLNKPNKQTILPLNQISKLFDKLPLRKLRGLGGKFGEDVCSRCNVTFIGELTKFTEFELQQLYDVKYGSWLYNICRGIDFELVKPRSSSQSIGCCKKFPGRNKLADIDALEHWLFELSTEIQERLEKDVTMNNRRATHLVLNMILEIDNKDVSISRSRTLPSYEAESIAKCCLTIIKENMIPFFRPNSQKYLTHAIKYLGISTGKFTSNSSANANSIITMFSNHINKDKKNDSIVPVNNTNNELSKKTQSNNSSNPIIKMFNKRVNKNQSTKSSISVDNISNNTVDNTNLCDQSNNMNCEETSASIQEEEATGSFFLQALKNMKKESPNVKNDVPVSDIGTTIEISTQTLRTPSVECIEQATTIESDAINTNKTTLQNNITEETCKTIDLTGNETQILNSSDDSNDSESKMNCINNERDTDKKLLNNRNEQIVGDYRAQYTEFALPTLNPELLKYIQCDICGKDILDNEFTIQTHKDYHFALELNAQQREEYRQQIKERINMAPPSSKSTSRPSKKMKLSSSKESKSVNITKYFQKQSNISNK